MRFDIILTRLTPTANFSFATTTKIELSRKAGETEFSEKEVEVKILDDYNSIIWNDENITKPTLEECEAEWLLIQQEQSNNEVIEQRQSAYPSVGDQLDAIYHAMDQGIIPKIEPMYTDCKTVKETYPKE